MQVVIWKLDKHQQPQGEGFTVEKGCTITHATLTMTPAAGSSSQGVAVGYYAVSTPDSSTVTLKWMDEAGRTGVVQVGCQQHSSISTCCHSA